MRAYQNAGPLLTRRLDTGLVAGLMDGQVLTVLEHQTVGDADWLRVSTQAGTEGWRFAKLVGPAGNRELTRRGCSSCGKEHERRRAG